MTHRQFASRETAAGLRQSLVLAGICLIAGATLVQPAPAETIISHAYSTFGEVKYPADMKHLDYVNPDAPKGGEISIWSQGNFNSFNQYARDGATAALNTIGSESLLENTADDPYGSYCFLCTTLEYDQDLTFVTFNLRQDVKFSDGTPMTAEDVLYSFNLFQTQGIPEYRNIVQGFIEAIEVENPYRITFRFNPASSKRDRVGLAGGTPVFSKKWFEETGARLDRATQAPFLSTGPYVLDNFEFNRRVVYARNPDYWGKDHPLMRGRANFDRIRVEYFGDSAAAFEGFKAGIYTFRAEASAQDWATGYDFPAIQRGWVKKSSIPNGTVADRLSWVFNLDKPQFQDERVRRAIAMMFNFDWSNATLYYGLYKQPESFWSATDLAASGVPEGAELALLRPLVDEGLIDASLLGAPAQTPVAHNAASNRPVRAVLREASALLEAAGWIEGSDGFRRNAAGEPLSVTILQFNPLFTPLVMPYIENLRQLGVGAEMVQVESAQYVERRRNGDFDITYQRFQMPFEPSLGMEQWFGSKTADDSSRNIMRLRNPAVDRLIGHVIEAQSLDGLKAAVRALDRVLRAASFDVPMYYNPDNWVAYYDMFEHPETLPPYSVGYLDFWWHNDEKATALQAAGAFRR
jgi:microcin C transport system substrate-binding protein